MRVQLTITINEADRAASIRRLRAALKCLWRSYRIKCIDIAEVPEAETPPAPRTPQNASQEGSDGT